MTILLKIKYKNYQGKSQYFLDYQSIINRLVSKKAYNNFNTLFSVFCEISSFQDKDYKTLTRFTVKNW